MLSKCLVARVQPQNQVFTYVCVHVSDKWPLTAVQWSNMINVKAHYRIKYWTVNADGTHKQSDQWTYHQVALVARSDPDQQTLSDYQWIILYNLYNIQAPLSLPLTDSTRCRAILYAVKQDPTML